MCFVYDSPICSASASSRALQCPPTPRKYRFVQSGWSNNDPLFFPSSSSILGSSTCINDSSFDDSYTTHDSLADRMNRLPPMVLALKPQNKACHRDAPSTKRQLSIHDIMGEIPPLPLTVSPPEQSPVDMSNSYSETSLSVTGAISLPELPPLVRSRSDPEQFSDSVRSSIGSSARAGKAPPIRRATKLTGSRRRSLNAKCA